MDNAGILLNHLKSESYGSFLKFYNILKLLLTCLVVFFKVICQFG